MEPHLTIVTLGVKNLDRAVHFYKNGLGWPMSSISGGDFAIFKISTGTDWPFSPGICSPGMPVLKTREVLAGSPWRKTFCPKRKLIGHCHRPLRPEEPSLRRHMIPSGEVIPGISPILTAIHGRWHGPRSLCFSKVNWCCLINGQNL